jgi:hypothetical protein
MIALYEESARLGDKDAHVELASLYCGGLCIPPHGEGENDTDREYRRRYEHSGVPVDYVKAYTHFLLAEDLKGHYGYQLDLLTQRMTDEDVAHARREASDWTHNE